MTTKHPAGLPYIIGNEAAERFSYYGMKSILVVFMTTYLLGRSGAPEVMSTSDAVFWYHIFGMGNYLVPVVGAVLADTVLGKYRTIIILSVVYCLGHLTLALDATRVGLAVGLTLIAIGSGGIKPCVSAHLGDQYTQGATRKISEGYSLFYIAINIGAFLSTILTPWLLERFGAHVAFALPGILMAIATVVFWKGRSLYVVQPPTPWRSYVSSLREPARRTGLLRILSLFVVLSVFWALFDQTGSSWVLQAEKMDRSIALPLGGRWELLASQVQALNPILILMFVPLCSWSIYPYLFRKGLLSVRGKVLTGLLLSAISFAIVGVTQQRIGAGESPSILWQVLAYGVLTAAEVVVSITTLELAYTSAPSMSRSLVTSFYLLSVSLGNVITAVVSGPMSPLVGGPEAPLFFFVFSVLSLGAGIPVWLILGRMRTIVPT